MVPNPFRSKRSITSGFGSFASLPQQRDADHADLPRGLVPQPANPEPTAASPAPHSSVQPAESRLLDHDTIARVAEEIWLAKGCPVGRDEENWREAEEQIRTQSRRKP